METHYSCTVRGVGRSHTWAVSAWAMATVIEELNFSFCLILNNFNSAAGDYIGYCIGQYNSGDC